MKTAEWHLTPINSSFKHKTSFANPDLDVFVLPCSGSGSFYHEAKQVRKTLISTVL
jgi:hypothetical protein